MSTAGNDSKAQPNLENLTPEPRYIVKPNEPPRTHTEMYSHMVWDTLKNEPIAYAPILTAKDYAAQMNEKGFIENERLSEIHKRAEAAEARVAELEQQLADNDLAFNHGEEVNAQLEAERDRLKGVLNITLSFINTLPEDLKVPWRRLIVVSGYGTALRPEGE